MNNKIKNIGLSWKTTHQAMFSNAHNYEMLDHQYMLHP